MAAGASRYGEIMGEPNETTRSTAELPTRLAESTPYLLTRAVRSAARLAQRHFGGETLRFPHYVTLCWVDHLGTCAQRDLAQAMDADPSDLVTVLSALEEAGLLARETDPSDRRRNLLAVTSEGDAWLGRRHAQAQKYDTALCASTDDDGTTLREQLATLITAPAQKPPAIRN